MLTSSPNLIPVELAILIGIKFLEELVYVGTRTQGLGSACENIKSKLLEFVKDKYLVFVLISHVKHLLHHLLEFISTHARLGLPGELFRLNLGLNRFNSRPDLTPVKLAIFVFVESLEELFKTFLRFSEAKPSHGL